MNRWLSVLAMILGLFAISLVAEARAVRPVPVSAWTSPDLIEIPLDVEARTPVYGYRIVATYPHDTQAFTEGLVYDQGVFYEGTGLRGVSDLRKVDVTTGNILQRRWLASQYFGEGVTLFHDKLYQLTWQSHIGFIYDRASFQLLSTFSYDTEGWGLTHNDQFLIMSDGTPVIHFIDPETMQPVRQIEVHDENGPIQRVNELEWIDGEIYANIWLTDRIARIDPDSGRVRAWIDLSGLLPAQERPDPQAVPNGIAWDATGQRLFVTGKLWPKLFQIELTPPTYQLYLGRITF